MKLQDFKKQLLKNKEFKKEYNKYDLAFEIGQILIEARILKGMTQEKLAQLINTKQSGVARVESGTYLPSLSFLNRVAQAFKTNLIVRFGFMEHAKITKINQKTNARLTELPLATNRSQKAYIPAEYYLNVQTQSDLQSVYLGGN